MKAHSKKIATIFTCSVLAVSMLPIPKTYAASTSETKDYYLNAYAPVRGIQPGGNAEISSYMKEIYSNQRLDESTVTYSYESNNPMVASVRDGVITAHANGYAEISVTATVQDGGASKQASDVIYVVVGSQKNGSVLVNSDEIEHAKANAEKYDWAKKEKEEKVKKADYYVGNYEKIYDLIISPIFPRSAWTIERNKKDPGTKTNIDPMSGKSVFDAYGHYSWRVDPLNQPFKVVDPIDGTTYPTNDFGAYYQSGLNEYGEFEPGRADQELLKNELYPEKGETWGVDNGFITTFNTDTPGGDARTFMAYYLHWGLWFHNGNIESTGLVQDSSGLIQQALSALREAYELTGDKKYSKAGAIILDRVADVYPEMKTSYFPEYFNSDGNRKIGRVVGCIWETELAREFAMSYDAFFDAYHEEEVIQFLQKKASDMKMLNQKRTANEIRQNIEDGILREVHTAVQNAEISGNFGMHQSALITNAVVLNTMPETNAWINYMFRPGAITSKPPYQITGGNILPQLYGSVNSNGFGNEVSPHYNYLWIEQLTDIADILSQYDGFEGTNLYENQKYQMMYLALTKVILSDGTVQLGDSGATGFQKIIYDLPTAIRGYKITQNPVFAQLAYKLNGNRVDGLHEDIYTKDPEAIQDEIMQIIKEKGEFHNISTNLSDFGLSYLTSNGTQNVNDILLNHTPNTGHGHYDKLALGIHAFGIDMTPDLGYPTAATSNPERLQWVSNTISHNTVTVNKTKQKYSADSGVVNLFDGGKNIQVMDISAPNAYDIQDYNRIVYMINMDEDNVYYVDLFNVLGGNHQVYSLNTLSNQIDSTTLTLKESEHETYAGDGFSYGDAAGTEHEQSGFTWLKDVKYEDHVQNFDITFNIEDKNQGITVEDGYKLKVSTHNGDQMDLKSVSLAKGIPPKYPEAPSSTTYLLMEREGENLDSQFRTVYEPFQGESKIKQISTPKVDGESDGVTVLKIELMNGRTDYIVYSKEAKKVRIDDKFDVEAKYAVVSFQGDELVQGYVNEGTFDQLSSQKVEGTIVDWSESDVTELTIQLKEKSQTEELQRLVGQTLYITSGERQMSYTIQAASMGKNAGEIVVQLMDASIINGLKDDADISQGFTYVINQGDSVCVKMSANARPMNTVYGLNITSDKDVLTQKGETAQFTYEIHPELTDGEIVWEILNDVKATINQQGVLTAGDASEVVQVRAWLVVNGEKVVCADASVKIELDDMDNNTPEKPEQPQEPVLPDHPEQPMDPDVPTNPDTPEHPQQDPVETGVEDHMVVFVVMVIVSGVGLCALLRKKRIM